MPSAADRHPRPVYSADYLPNLVGIGLRGPHYRDILEQKPDLGWLEVHPENYFGGGIHRHFLSQIRADYEISFHAVGMSLGSAHGLDPDHLHKIKELIDIFEPFQLSDHASWSATGNAHLNDLLPLPYTQETLDTLQQNISIAQDYFARPILVENPSTYVSFHADEMPEYELLNRLAETTGCGLLLDCNNIFVQAHNHGFDPYHYISQIKPQYVGEIHLAGYSERVIGTETLLIDTHSKRIKPEVWELYGHALRHIGTVPTLIEWDLDLPPLSVLMEEAKTASEIMQHRTNTLTEDRL